MSVELKFYAVGRRRRMTACAGIRTCLCLYLRPRRRELALLKHGGSAP